MNCSYKEFSERATTSAVMGSKGDGFGEGTGKKVFNGRKCYRHGIQNRITNSILQKSLAVQIGICLGPKVHVTLLVLCKHKIDIPKFA